MDDTLTHLLECPKGPWWIRRHNAVRDCWKMLIATATGIEPQAEQLVPIPARRPAGEQEYVRKADLVLATTGAPTYIDAVVTSPLASSWMERLHTATVSGAAAANAERVKHGKYHPTPVTALAMEAFGRHGQEALLFLQTLKHTADSLGNEFRVSDAYQALSLTVQRANAVNILTHLHYTPPAQPAPADSAPAPAAPTNTQPAPADSAPAPAAPAGPAAPGTPSAAELDARAASQPVPHTPR
jgi:hypothetical protein